MHAFKQSRLNLQSILLGGVVFVAVLTTAFCCAAGIISGPRPDQTQTNVESLQTTSPPVVVNISNEKDPWDKINIIAAIFGAAATVASVIFAWKTTQQAQQATNQSDQFVRGQRLADLFEDMQKLTFLTAEEKNRVKEAANFEQDKMIPLDEAVGRKITTNANIMEKIAFCWKNNLVDRTGIEEELGEDYILLYDQIKKQPHILWLNRRGEEVIKDTPSATLLRNHLAEKIKQNNNETRNLQ